MGKRNKNDNDSASNASNAAKENENTKQNVITEENENTRTDVVSDSDLNEKDNTSSQTAANDNLSSNDAPLDELSDNDNKKTSKHGGMTEQDNGLKVLDKKYMKITKYAIFIILCGSIIFMCIRKWSYVQTAIVGFFKVLAPFFAAFIIAFLLSPLVNWNFNILKKLDKNNKHRKLLKGISIFAAYIFVLAILIIALNFIIPQIAQSVSRLNDNMPDVYNKMIDILNYINDKYPQINVEYIQNKLANIYPQLIKYGTNLATNAIPHVYNISMWIVHFVINIVLAIVISVYMIADKDEFKYYIKRFVYAILPEKKGDTLCKVSNESAKIFSSYLVGAAVDSLLVGVICCIVMLILRLPYAVLISVIIGLTNMIPYFGPFIGSIPAILILLCVDPKKAIIFLIMIVAIQQFDSIIMNPRIVGQTTGLNPFWVVFAITVGGAYFGILGLFLGVPVVAVCAYLVNRFVVNRLHGKHIKALEENEREQ